MQNQVFNSKDIAWENNDIGQGKTLVSRSQLGSSAFRLFKLDPKSEFETHEHEYTQIMYFLSGTKGLIVLDEEITYEISEGLVVVVTPKQCHKILNQSDNEMEILVIENYNDHSSSVPFVDF